MSILRLIQKPHPFIFNGNSIFVPGFITFLIFVLFQPLGLEDLSLAAHVVVALLFGLVASLSVWATVRRLQSVMPQSFTEESWTLGKEIVLIISVLVVIISFIFALFLALDLVTVSVGELFQLVFLRTLFISFFPIVISVLYEQYSHQKEKWKQAETLNQQLRANQEKTIAFPTLPVANTAEPLIIEAENGKVALQLAQDQLAYLKSEGNYVDVFFLEEKNIQKTVVRNRLKVLLERLPNQHFFHCHKSYVVNINWITEVRGNARNLEIRLQYSMDWLPVSRSKSTSLQQVLQDKKQEHSN